VVANLRLVPANSWIVQGIDARFRKFTVLSLFERMSGELSCVLLDAADNHKVVLMCLFEARDAAMKERVFAALMHHRAPMICRFSYWYFMRTQRREAPAALAWVLSVLKFAFTDHGGLHAEPALVTALHLALVFVEEFAAFFDAFVPVHALPERSGTMSPQDSLAEKT
jgi:hypothetical protein